MAEATGNPVRRDPALIRSQLPLGRAVTGYFSPEVRGIANVAATGPVLVVGNHSGMYYMPDAWVAGMALAERRGIEQPTYSLAYDLLFAIPPMGNYLRRLGVMPASPEAARRALEEEGAAVLVYPGGDYEACRPRSQAGRVDLGGHDGFVRLALRTGVPVVPVVGYGAHHTVVVLWRGAGIARALRLGGLRIGVFPIVLGGPLGVTPILTPPLPAAVIVEFLAPLDWSRYGPDAADDPEVVGACYREVVSLMQAELDALHAELPHPLVTGSARLARRLPSALARLASGPSHPTPAEPPPAEVTPSRPTPSEPTPAVRAPTARRDQAA